MKVIVANKLALLKPTLDYEIQTAIEKKLSKGGVHIRRLHGTYPLAHRLIIQEKNHNV